MDFHRAYLIKRRAELLLLKISLSNYHHVYHSTIERRQQCEHDKMCLWYMWWFVYSAVHCKNIQKSCYRQCWFVTGVEWWPKRQILCSRSQGVVKTRKTFIFQRFKRFLFGKCVLYFKNLVIFWKFCRIELFGVQCNYSKMLSCRCSINSFDGKKLDSFQCSVIIVLRIN